ncbi:hypothetical protein CONLIGDRAFT_638710 [Coniochaeta ligniaria NRRL 30616]|uniref:DUF6546 domain-containing protein n=1 Tax=Coniochaeta ligniaria NRRL 30616 TaxID=1408157 RepID=A0A1J7J4M8_9PEZI|nr:hypothetical protein CONLIGDRAFT_638710 [Coniochaeta ligniaria NRRL 30616]
MPVWNIFPKEIQLQILKHVAEGHDRPPRRLGRGLYASVCKEWQDFFEPYTFRRLVLRPSRLPQFQRTVSGDRGLLRLSYLSEIYFTIDLPAYDCSECATEETRAATDNNEAKFTQSVFLLLYILKEWTVGRWEELKRNNPDLYGLQKLPELDLYIGAMSPSDCEHKVNDYRLHKDYRFWFESEVDFRTMHIEYMARNPVQATGSHWEREETLTNNFVEVLSGVDTLSRQRVTGYGPLGLNLNFSFWDTGPLGSTLPSILFPEVEKITGLFLPRHFFRDIGGIALEYLVRCCPRLKRLAYERWAEGRSRGLASSYVPEFSCFLELWMPTSLEVLNLFEDHNRTFPFGQATAAGSRYRPFHLDHELGQALLTGSKNLRELTACFVLDAAEFFHRFFEHSIQIRPGIFNAEQSWARLERLTLTAEVFSITDHSSVSLVHDLLFAAGTAAGLMPKLELMEIWDYAWNVARIFRYEVVDDDTVSVTWLSNLTEPLFIHRLPDHVGWIWQEVARNRELTRHHTELRGLPEPDEDDPRTWIRYIDVIYHLRSRDRVLLPMSRAQVRLEIETDLANDTPRTTLVDPLTWEEVNVTPRSMHGGQAWCWELLRSRGTPAAGLFDFNANARQSGRRFGDPRMLHP